MHCFLDFWLRSSVVSILNQFKNIYTSLASVAQWIECQPANQRVTGWIPNQGTYLGCRPGPQQGVLKRQPHIDASLPLFLPLCLKINLKN